MRKSVYLLLALLLAVSLVVVGCGGEKQQAADDNGSEAQNLLMATGGTGGTYYPLGGTMANVWNSNIEGLNVTVSSTGASIENMRLLASGEAKLAMAMNGPAQAAWNGEGDFNGQAMKDFRAVGVIYPEVMQIITPADSGIKTVADLKGKRVSIGPPGSGTASAAIKILEAYGIDPNNDIKQLPATFSDAARQIKDGQIDAAFAVLAVPAANVVDITTSTPVTIVDIEGEGLQKILDSAPAFTPYEIPGGTYEGQDEVAHTVSQWAVLYVQKDLPNDLVYNMTKVMYEKTDEIAAGHARGKQITIDNAIKGIKPVEFHPGAIKYYKEKGMM